MADPIKTRFAAGPLNTLMDHTRAIQAMIRRLNEIATTFGVGWSDITGKPNTIAGFGITDAVSDSELMSHETDTLNVHGIPDTSQLETQTGAADKDTAALAAHVALTDPHPVYLTVAEATVFMTDHVAAPDPHPGYVTHAEGTAAYAPLVHTHKLKDIVVAETAPSYPIFPAVNQLSGWWEESVKLLHLYYRNAAGVLHECNTLGFSPLSILQVIATAWARVAEYSGSGTLVDQSGHGHDAQWGTVAVADASEPHYLVPEGYSYQSDPGKPYAFFPQTMGNFCLAPSISAYDLSLELDIRVRIEMTAPYSNQRVMVGRFGGATATQAYAFATNSEFLRLYLGSGTSTSNATSTVAFNTVIADGTPGWVRATWRKSDGRVQFFTSLDYDPVLNTGTWTQLGANVTLYSGVTLATGTIAMSVGSNTAGTASNFLGKIYRAMVLNAIDGSSGNRVFDCDFQDIGLYNSTRTSVTDSSANSATVTITRSSTAGKKMAIVDRPMILFGTDDYLEIANHADLNFGAGQEFTVVMALRDFALSNSSIYMAKKVGAALGDIGWALYGRLTGPTIAAVTSDGITARTPLSSGVRPAGTVQLIALKRAANGDLTVHLDGVAGPVTTSANNSLSNTEALRIGRYSGAGTTYRDFELFGYAIFRGALSDQDMAAVGTELLLT